MLFALLDLPTLGATADQPCAPRVVPLKQAHPHNHYEHPRPLLAALAHGFCSVEPEVFLTGQKGSMPSFVTAADRQDGDGGPRAAPEQGHSPGLGREAPGLTHSTAPATAAQGSFSSSPLPSKTPSATLAGV
ncbi:MAG TPA: hypothetical protein VG013_17235 [Gemmataceae bacterium]|jgi:hypothetical protein|nr:hypothetical protein [Gemmataceae bacterium]